MRCRQIQRQPAPRAWCNCISDIRKLRQEQRRAKDIGDERMEALISNEIGGIDYAHGTGRCRFEYDADEKPEPSE